MRLPLPQSSLFPYTTLFRSSISGATQCTYKGSDGSVFDCNSCSDCSGAAQRVASWCTTGSSSSTDSSSSSGGGSDASCFSQATSACQTCCAANHSAGAGFYAQVYLECGCGSCASTS